VSVRILPLVLPLSVQFPEAAKVTGRPDDAFTATANGGSSTKWLGMGLNEMLWLSLMVNVKI
jgi:hypothetical protein